MTVWDSLGLLRCIVAVSDPIVRFMCVGVLHVLFRQYMRVMSCSCVASSVAVGYGSHGAYRMVSVGIGTEGQSRIRWFRKVFDRLRTECIGSHGTFRHRGESWGSIGRAVFVVAGLVSVGQCLAVMDLLVWSGK